jgi:hypothetical protein
MNLIAKALKPTSIFLTIFFLLAPAYYQSVSAAMIGTKTMLKPDRSQNTRDDLHDLLSREDVQKVLVACFVEYFSEVKMFPELHSDE